MAENFRKLLDEHMALQKRNGQPAQVSPAAYAMADMMTSAMYRYNLHVTSCQNMALRAYERTVEMMKRVEEQERLIRELMAKP